MNLKVKHCFLIIFLISVLNLHCSEARRLFNITEDAISTGREILREVEKTDLRNTKLTTIAEAMINIIRKFNIRHNKPRRFSYLYNKVNVEFKSQTLVKHLEQLDHLHYKFSPAILDRLIENYDKYVTIFFKGNVSESRILEVYYVSNSYIEENVFDLRRVETELLPARGLHHLLLKKDPDTGYSIMDILTKQSSNWVCWSSSRQQILYTILNYIITVDTFGYLLTQYFLAAFKVQYEVPEKLGRYELRRLKKTRTTWTEKDVIKRMKKLENDFIERNSELLAIFVQAMAGQSREAWSCRANENEYRDQNKQLYTKLENLFQMYVINEVDLNEDGTCKKECSDYDQTKQYGCYDGGICKHQRTCGGSLRDCGKKIDATMNICVNDKNETERYRFIKAEDKTYGTDSYCDEYVLAKSWPRGFYKCTYCTCTCEEMSSKSDRYFNLRPVQSDIDSNYVITNAQFVKENNIVHIQIEEGKLLNNGFINRSSIRWKEIENYTVYDKNVKSYDIHTITWNKRKVYLGDYDSPQNCVVTGLRISSVLDGIKLEIGSTSFDFTTGKLSNAIQWTSHSDFAYEWSELKFEDKDEIITNSNAKYIKFTTNNLKIDAGQSTIPYLDTDEVINNPYRVPLSGAGLFTKSKKGVGSYLALKFLTYDFVNNM